MNNKEFNEVFEKPKTKKLNNEKEKNDFLSSLLLNENDKPQKDKKIKKEISNERKLYLIENLKNAREKKKLNKEVIQPKVEEKKELSDPEYLEWKKQKQSKQNEPVKMDVKPEPVKIQVKTEPVKPEIKYIKTSTFKKPLWAK